MTSDRRPARDHPRVSAGRGLLLAVRLLTELALLGVLAYDGSALATGVPMRLVLMVLLPVAAVAVWGRYVAPRASRRLPDPVRLVVELALFGVSALALTLVGHAVVALVYGVTAAATAVLVRRWAPGS